MTEPTILERFTKQFADVERMSGWDTTPLTAHIGPSNRGRGPGLSVFVMTACGVQFEQVIGPDDDTAAFFCAQVH